MNIRDWKDPSNRQELFNRYFQWRILSHDLDHIHYYTYLTKNYTREQKMWYAICFGFCYRTPQAFAFTESIPNPLIVPDNEIEEWNNANYERQSFGTDRRYAKGKFAKQVASMKQWLDGKTLEQKIDGICSSTNSKENFNKLYAEIRSVYFVGRMGGWLTLQALYDLCDLNIDPNEILLEGFHPNGDSSLGSIWNGLCAVSNTDKYVAHGYHCTDDDVIWGREMLMKYTSEAEKFSGFKIDSYRKESIYCQFSRLFKYGPDKSAEMPGHASSDAVSRYEYFKTHWPEINLSSYRAALRDQPGLIKGMNMNAGAEGWFSETGELLNMHELFPDMNNLWEIKKANPNKYLVRSIWEDDGLEVPVIDSSTSTWGSDLLTTPKYYKI